MNEDIVVNIPFIRLPYNLYDIHDFMLVTGLYGSQLQKTLERFYQCGILDLPQVVALVKLGHFKILDY
jgi:hypothetical protein